MKKFLFISLLFFSISILVKGIEIFEYIPFLFSSSVADNLPQQFLNELDKKIVFTGKMEDTEKIVTIYKEGDNLIYVYGLEGKKPEIKLVGKADKNLFKNFGGMDLEPWYHLVFKNKNSTKNQIENQENSKEKELYENDFSTEDRKEIKNILNY